MSSTIRRVASPTCISCVRALAWHDLGHPPRTLCLQVRGKKKKPNRHHMQYVKLTTNITGYGPKGAIMAVPPGQMRNYWYPQGIAHYITGAELTEVKRKPEMVTSRDPEFGKETAKEPMVDEDVVKVETQLLSPQRSEELLQTLLPDYIEFFRPVISAPEKSKMQFPEAEVAQREIQPQAIFGSVTIQDILQNINEFLARKEAEAANSDAGRIVLRPEDVRLVRGGVTTGVEDDRIKFLGDFEFEMRVKGAGAVRRRVRVSTQA